MRAERRRQIEEQMLSEQKRQQKRKKKNKTFRIIAWIYLLTAASLAFFVYRLDVFPMKYLISGAVILFVVTLFTVPTLMSSKAKNNRKLSSAAIAILFAIVFGAGTYYMASTTAFLGDITDASDDEVAPKSVNVTSDSYNIYVSGVDEEGYRSDVNMVVTVNPRTNKILITSIPRDTYLTLYSNGQYDKLTHAGAYGLSEVIGSVENWLGIDVNYYTKVNYSALENIIDAIGGIDVVSEVDFTTSGMDELDGIHFVEGENHLSGREALAFCRERKSFISGDLQRNRNQQIVFEAIFKKLTSKRTLLLKYSSIISAVSGDMQTNFSKDEITKLARYQLVSMPGWETERNAIVGDPGYSFCYSVGGYAATVIVPEENRIEASNLIYEVMNEN